jgi:hypothetical protein
MISSNHELIRRALLILGISHLPHLALLALPAATILYLIAGKRGLYALKQAAAELAGKANPEPARPPRHDVTVTVEPSRRIDRK